MIQFYSRMKQVEEATRGKVKMTWLGDGVIAQSPKTYDLTVAGTYDVGEASTGSKAGAHSLHDVVSLPFIAPKMLAASMAAYALYEEDKAVQAQFKDVKVLLLGSKIASHIFTTKKPIRTVDDFKGLRIDVTSSTMADIVKLLGGVPVRMDNAEVYSSLERGILDGAMFHWNLAYGYKMGEICKYATMLDITRSCGYIVMNLNKWNSLPADVQKAMMDVSGYKGAAAMANHYAASEQDLIKGVTAGKKFEIIHLKITGEVFQVKKRFRRPAGAADDA